MAGGVHDVGVEPRCFVAGWRVLRGVVITTVVDLLRNPTHVVIASDDGRVVGFTTAISDGVLSAYIPLLEVLPAYQGRGIGTELMRRLLADVGSLYMIDVACDLGTLPFYERLGFSAGTSAAMRNYGWRQGDWRSCDHAPAFGAITDLRPGRGIGDAPLPHL